MRTGPDNAGQDRNPEKHDAMRTGGWYWQDARHTPQRSAKDSFFEISTFTVRWVSWERFELPSRSKNGEEYLIRVDR